MTNNVYLGKRVPDLGKGSLSNPLEVLGISFNILLDYATGKIDYKTASSRLNLLELIVQKDQDFSNIEKTISHGIVDLTRPALKASQLLKSGLLGDDK
ncbi:MAG: hypothetical protein J7K23_00995 [Thermoproteales archaeon]|nr:hypothetical protein [Thermoproteales archaeon]